MGKKITMEGGAEINLGLIITPFLDFAFQLLAFFIMTYNPLALEGHIAGRLVPPTGGPRVGADQLEMGFDPVPEVGDFVRVIVKAVHRDQIEGGRGDGQPSRIEIKRVEDGRPETIADTTDSLDQGLRKLEGELKKLRRQPNAAQTNIKLEGDHNLRHVYLMQVYDVCRLSGFDNVSFVAPTFAGNMQP